MKDLVEHVLANGDFIESTAATLSPGLLVTDLSGFDLGDQAGVVMKTESRQDDYVVWLWMTESEEIRKFLLPKDTAYQAKEPPEGMLRPEPYDLRVLDEMGDLPSIRTLPDSYWPDDPNYDDTLTDTLWRPTFRRYPYYRYYSKEDEMKRTADADDVARTILPLLKAGVEKYDPLFDSESGDYYAREFDRWVDSWAAIIGDEVWKAEVVRRDGDVSALDYTDVAVELAKILFKMEKGDMSEKDFYHDLKELEDEAVDVAFEAASREASTRTASILSSQLNQSFPQLSDREANKLVSKLNKANGDPDAADAALETADAMLDGMGVEPLTPENAYVDRYYNNIVALYVNMGDTYAPTILYDTEYEQFMVTSWGDFLEGWEKEQAAEREASARTAASKSWEDLSEDQQEHLNDLYRDTQAAERHFFDAMDKDLPTKDLEQYESVLDQSKAEFQKYLKKYISKEARTADKEYPMNSGEAYHLDCHQGVGEFYADEEDETYYVFGTESGFAYSSYSDLQSAEEEAEKMNEECARHRQGRTAETEHGWAAVAVDIHGEEHDVGVWDTEEDAARDISEAGADLDIVEIYKAVTEDGWETWERVEDNDTHTAQTTLAGWWGSGPLSGDGPLDLLYNVEQAKTPKEGAAIVRNALNSTDATHVWGALGVWDIVSRTGYREWKAAFDKIAPGVKRAAKKLIKEEELFERWGVFDDDRRYKKFINPWLQYYGEGRLPPKRPPTIHDFVPVSARIKRFAKDPLSDVVRDLEARLNGKWSEGSLMMGPFDKLTELENALDEATQIFDRYGFTHARTQSDPPWIDYHFKLGSNFVILRQISHSDSPKVLLEIPLAAAELAEASTRTAASNVERFDEELERLLDEMSGGERLYVPGAYEVFSEELNNDVLDELGTTEVSDTQFDGMLETLVDDLTGGQVLRIPGAYEVFAEELNNEVLDQMEEREASTRTAAMEWPSQRKVNYPTPDTTHPTFTDDGEWVDEKSPLQKAFPKTKDYPEEMEVAANGFWEDYQMFKIRKIPGHHSNESLDAHKYAFMWARNNEYDIPKMRELMDYMSKIGLFPQSTYDAWDQMVSYDAMLPHMHNDTA
jgi:hypothetical protein